MRRLKDRLIAQGHRANRQLGWHWNLFNSKAWALHHHPAPWSLVLNTSHLCILLSISWAALFCACIMSHMDQCRPLLMLHLWACTSVLFAQWDLKPFKGLPPPIRESLTSKAWPEENTFLCRDSQHCLSACPHVSCTSICSMMGHDLSLSRDFA